MALELELEELETTGLDQLTFALRESRQRTIDMSNTRALASVPGELALGSFAGRIGSRGPYYGAGFEFIGP